MRLDRIPEDELEMLKRIDRDFKNFRAEVLERISRIGVMALSPQVFAITERNATNTALATSFTTMTAANIVPPSDWGSYDIWSEAWAAVSGVTAGDNIEIRTRAVGTAIVDNTGSTSRFPMVSEEFLGVSGTISATAQIRNASAAAGTCFTFVSRYIAIRRS